MVKVKITVVEDSTEKVFEDFKRKKEETYYEFMTRMVKNDYRLNLRTRDNEMVLAGKQMVEEGIIRSDELEIV